MTYSYQHDNDSIRIRFYANVLSFYLIVFADVSSIALKNFYQFFINMNITFKFKSSKENMNANEIPYQ